MRSLLSSAGLEGLGLGLWLQPRLQVKLWLQLQFQFQVTMQLQFRPRVHLLLQLELHVLVTASGTRSVMLAGMLAVMCIVAILVLVMYG